MHTMTIFGLFFLGLFSHHMIIKLSQILDVNMGVATGLFVIICEGVYTMYKDTCDI